MKLKKLLKNLPQAIIRGSKDCDITGITSDSKMVAPGYLFIAKRGNTYDGADFIPQAIAGGAVAILSDIYDPFLKNVSQVVHPHPEDIEAKIAATYFNHPSEELTTFAVTGTNGKTTTTYLIKHLLDNFQLSCGLIGTIENIIGELHFSSNYTTPDVITGHKLLCDMLRSNCKAAVVEVSSHALTQGRTSEMLFDIALFTNLSQDHLDYHKDMDEYARAKQLLFRSLSPDHVKYRDRPPPLALVNSDDPYSSLIVEGCKASVITYGIEKKSDFTASDLVITPEGTTFVVTYKDKSYSFSWNLVGRYNVYNALAAIASVASLGIPLEKMVPVIKHFPSVSGRLESISNLLGIHLFVDFAHTPDALINVLKCLTEMKRGRIITLFGCGGDRDRGKRPLMAAAAESYSDLVIVTSDNPRSEDPEKICQEIVKGFKQSDFPMIELDREKAIEQAINLAEPQDIILIAGKGHESEQVFAWKKVSFDDRKIAKELCDRKAKNMISSSK